MAGETREGGSQGKVGKGGDNHVGRKGRKERIKGNSMEEREKGIWNDG